MSKELKPCPFCGGEAEFIQKGISGNIRLGFVKCNECGIKLKQENCTENYARDAWNTRKPIKKIVEELEEKVELAHKRYVDCPVNSPCYERYRTQYNERRMCLDIVKGGGVNDA